MEKAQDGLEGKRGDSFEHESSSENTGRGGNVGQQRGRGGITRWKKGSLGEETTSKSAL